MDKKKNTKFKQFHAAFPPDSVRIPVEEETLNELSELLPPALIHEYVNFGAGSYGNGFYWLIHPEENMLNEKEWPAVSSGFPLLRTAFGEVLIINQENFLWLNVFSGNTFEYPLVAEVIFEFSLLDTDFVRSAKYGLLFDQALKKYGLLSHDECYGLAPLPKLGGDFKLKHIYRAKLDEYLHIIAQL